MSSQNSSNHVKKNSKLGINKKEYQTDPFEFWKQNEKYFSIDTNTATDLSNLAIKLIEENSIGFQSYSDVSIFTS